MNGKPQPQFFALKTPLLTQGRLDNHVAATDMLRVTVKVYAAGGENSMHMHPHEDHGFIVLQGQATFHIETDDNISILKRWDGVMLPRGTSYWFLSSGDENLVLLRIGAATHWPENQRAHPDGRPFPGLGPDNKEVDLIINPAAFFAA